MQAYQPPLFPHTKRCRSCGEMLPLERFGQHKRNRDGLRAVCRPCNVASAQDWYARNTEHQLEYNRQYRSRNYERIQARRAAYRAANRDKIRETDRRYRDRLGDEYLRRRREQAALLRRFHPEQAYRRVAEWYRRNPEAVAAKHARRRARKLQSEGQFTAKQFRAMCDRFGGHCLCCGVIGPLSVDHVVPLAHGGSNDIGNIQPLCKSCNQRKGVRTIDYRRSAFAAILHTRHSRDASL